MEPLATVEVKNHDVTYQFPDERINLNNNKNVVGAMKDFFAAFKSTAKYSRDELNGFFGYISYESIKYFEDVDDTFRDLKDDFRPIHRLYKREDIGETWDGLEESLFDIEDMLF